MFGLCESVNAKARERHEEIQLANYNMPKQFRFVQILPHPSTAGWQVEDSNRVVDVKEASQNKKLNFETAL